MDNKKEIYKVTNKIIKNIDNHPSPAYKRQTLAKIRNSIGKPINEATEVWPLLFDNLPEGFLGDNRGASFEEQSILTCLQLYALHQQANDKPVYSEFDNYNNIGFSLKEMRTEENSGALDRRFNAMLISETFTEVSNHLRHLIKLLRAKSPETKINYGNLSQDLYWFLRGYKKEVRLNWARQYYWTNKNGDDKDEK